MNEMTTTKGRPEVLGAARDRGLLPQMLNHAAYVTHDVAATVEFYTRILGMELASTIMDDTIPSDRRSVSLLHIFFRMADGSTIAFFESPGAAGSREVDASGL